ncbi:MAG: hypothetical protein ACRD51_14235, partial [Candidatus Acidiferrum sp.]
GIADGKLKVVGILDGSGFLRSGTFFTDAFGATAKDEFSLSKMPVALHFDRDSSQAITGFKLDAGRTLGMMFSRRNGSAKQEALWKQRLERAR